MTRLVMPLVVIALAVPQRATARDVAVDGLFALAWTRGQDVEFALTSLMVEDNLTGRDVTGGEVPTVNGLGQEVYTRSPVYEVPTPTANSQVHIGDSKSAVQEKGNLFGVDLALDPERLSPELKRWLQQTVQVYAGARPVCTVKVTSLRAVNGVFDSDDFFAGGGDVVTARGLRSGLQGAGINARAQPVEGNCKGAQWGRWTSHPAVRILEPAPAGKLKAKALAAFRQLPEYSDLQKIFEWDLRSQPPKEKPASPLWDEFQGSGPKVSLWGEDFVTVYGLSDPCRQQSEMGVRFDLKKPDPWSAPVRLPELRGAAPTVMLDVDGDGELELFNGFDEFTRFGNWYRSVQGFPHRIYCDHWTAQRPSQGERSSSACRSTW